MAIYSGGSRVSRQEDDGLLEILIKNYENELNNYNLVRKDYMAQIADRDVTVQDKVRKLANRVPPEEIANAKLELETQFRQEKKSLEEKMEQEIESIRNSKG